MATVTAIRSGCKLLTKNQSRMISSRCELPTDNKIQPLLWSSINKRRLPHRDVHTTAKICCQNPLTGIPSYADTKSSDCVNLLSNDMLVLEDFVSEEEENSLLSEIEPYFARLRYEHDHWDDAILGYRETEKSTWKAANSEIIDRMKAVSFKDVAKPTDFVHVLDLQKDGEIKPHIDSVRFCGDTIAGISLLSQCVMRLVEEGNKENMVEILLKPRSLYIMRHAARYKYTHAVSHNDNSYFKGDQIAKGRRISIICRNNPTSSS